MDETRKCTRCEGEKPIEMFRLVLRRNGKRTRMAWCRSCEKAHYKAYAETPEYRAHRRAYRYRYRRRPWIYEKHLERERLRSRDPVIRQKSKNRLRQKQLAVYIKYGDQCACCGESNRAFFTLDHVNSDGSVDRQKRTQYKIWYDLAKNPVDSAYQILCFNCNLGRQMRGKGVCPHELTRVGLYA